MAAAAAAAHFDIFIYVGSLVKTHRLIAMMLKPDAGTYVYVCAHKTTTDYFAKSSCIIN